MTSIGKQKDMWQTPSLFVLSQYFLKIGYNLLKAYIDEQ
jgi:hypothetical protein